MLLATLTWGSREAAHRRAAFYVRLLARLALRRWRRTALRNLSFALPGADPEAVLRGSYESIGRVLVALARFPSIGRDNVGDWIRYEGFEHFEEVKRRGKGVLFATAHLGNWELSAFAHALMAEPMHVVVRALDNPYLDAWIRRRRSLSGNNVIEKRDFARAILRALGRNEAVGVLIDQNTAAAEGIFIDFFGRKACVSTGFARIAGRSGAGIIPGFALWSAAEGKYVLRFYPPIYPSGDAEQDTRLVHAKLEAVIREHPDQWLWMHRRWKTRPPGEPPIY